MTTASDNRQSSRREAWRAQLLQEQVAEEMARRRNEASMHVAIAAGIAIGVIGSVSIRFV